jgi:hypothetical protein
MNEEVNPFVKNPSFQLTCIEIVKDYHVVDPSRVDAGIATRRHGTKSETFFMDSPRHTSVFRPSRVKGVVFGMLGQNGRDVLLFIIYSLGESTDYINLKHSRLHKELGISRFTAAKGIQQLVESFFIMKKGQSEYWVNPYFIFCGNRKGFYDRIDENIIKTEAVVRKGLK